MKRNREITIEQWMLAQRLAEEKLLARIAAGELPQYVRVRDVVRLTDMAKESVLESIECRELPARNAASASARRPSWRIELPRLVAWWRSRLGANNLRSA